MKNQSTQSRAVSWFLHGVLLAIGAWHMYLTVAAYLANQYFTHDVGRIEYVVYSTWHGGFFFDIDQDRCYLRDHFAPAFLLLIPFQFMFRHVLTIPLLQTAALVSAAWAVAWMASGLLRPPRRDFSAFPPLALAAGILFLSNPLTGSLLNSYHFENFPLAFMLWALAALAKKRNGLFWVFLTASLGFKEDIGIYWLFFAGWWFFFGWEKNNAAPSWKTRLPRGIKIFLLALGWLLLSVFAISCFARLEAKPEVLYAERYEWLGDTPTEKIYNIATHPFTLCSNLGHIYRVVLPSVLLLPLLAPSSLLLLLPGACIMGLTNFAPMHELFYYYSYPLLPFLFLGTVLAIARITGFTKSLRHRKALRAGLCLILLAAAAIQFCGPTRTDGKYRLPDNATPRHAWIREGIRKFIPPGASVAAQFDLLCQIPHRMNLSSLSEKHIQKAEYWVIDKKGFYLDIGGTSLNRILQEGETLAKQGKAKILVNKDGFIILRRLDGIGR